MEKWGEKGRYALPASLPRFSMANAGGGVTRVATKDFGSRRLEAAAVFDL